MFGRVLSGTRLAAAAVAVAGGGALLGIVIVGVPGVMDVVRASVGLAALLVPGVVLAIVVRPTRPLRRLDLVLIASALSLGGLAVIGLVLNLLPGGVSRTSWLVLIVITLVAIAVLARGGVPSLRRETLVRPKPVEAVAMVAAGILVAVAIVIARVGVNQPSEPFSALWIVPVPSGSLEIGLDNHELGATTYRVDVLVDGTFEQNFRGITLAVGERWTMVVERPADGSTVEVLAYLVSKPDVIYRRVTISAAAGGQ